MVFRKEITVADIFYGEANLDWKLNFKRELNLYFPFTITISLMAIFYIKTNPNLLKCINA
jgi:hypothetical protein